MVPEEQKHKEDCSIHQPGTSLGCDCRPEEREARARATFHIGLTGIASAMVASNWVHQTPHETERHCRGRSSEPMTVGRAKKLAEKKADRKLEKQRRKQKHRSKR